MITKSIKERTIMIPEIPSHLVVERLEEYAALILHLIEPKQGGL